MHIFDSKMNSLRTIISTWNWTFSIRTYHFWSKLSSKHFLWWKMFFRLFRGKWPSWHRPENEFLDRNDLALVWNRFEQVRTKILTFKFELKSHFIIIQNLKMLKYLQLRRLEFARSGSLFFQITKLIKIQISKIDLRNSGKFQSAKLQKLQSSVSIRQQIRFNTALLAEITGVNEGETRVKLKLMRVKVRLRVKIDKNRVCPPLSW